MTTFLTVLLVMALLATLGVLVAGVVGMVRGTGDAHRSNRLMQYRVALQAAALVLFVALLYAFKG